MTPSKIFKDLNGNNPKAREMCLEMFKDIKTTRCCLMFPGDFIHAEYHIKSNEADNLCDKIMRNELTQKDEQDVKRYKEKNKFRLGPCEFADVMNREGEEVYIGSWRCESIDLIEHCSKKRMGACIALFELYLQNSSKDEPKNN